MTGRVSLPLDQFRRAPFAGDEEISFDRTEVKWFGKIAYYGDARTLYVVKISGIDFLIFVKAVDQSPEDKKWLRKIAKQVTMTYATREIGFVLRGVNVSHEVGSTKNSRRAR